MKTFICTIALLLAMNSISKAQFHADTLAQVPAINFPVALAFAPDHSNRLFFTEKTTGRVRIIRNDTLLPDPFLTVPVSSYGEQGLLGITFHPQYPDSPFIYIYYTRTGDSANVVARFTDSSGVGTHQTILMTIPRIISSASHNGGNLHFGPDGKLYVSVGDYFISSYAQDTSNGDKRGKIHRLNPDGSIPADNPFPNNTIYAYGCRNSFDFTWDKLTGKMYASENGPNCNDELNNIVSGGNYGWPIDGNCQYFDLPQYIKPMYYWPQTIAVTGVIVYRDTILPELYGKLLIGSYNLGKVLQFNLNSAGDSVVGAPINLVFIGSSVIDVETGPDGYLYIANSTFGGIGRILRLRPAVVVPPPPVLQYPGNSSPHVAIPFSLSWNQSPEAGTYDVQVALDSQFNSIVFDTTVSVDTTAHATNLSYVTTYYWRVRASNRLGSSAYSEIGTFTTALAPPPPPELAYPPYKALNQPTTITLGWHPSETAVTYNVQLAPDPTFTTITFSATGIADTFKTVTSLAHSKAYYWRVTATNIGGTSISSDTLTFKTIVAAPVAPSLNSPADLAIEQPLNDTVTWSAVASAEHYWLQIATDTFFTTLVYDDTTLTSPSSQVPLDSYGTKYFWRVRASNIGGMSPWSSIRRFTTMAKLYSFSSSWNLLSLPLKNSGKLRNVLFPTVSSPAFIYKQGHGYMVNDTLTSGKGFWLKFDSSQDVGLPGKPMFYDTVSVTQGWNLIGSLTNPMSTDSITSIPPNIIASPFFSFDGIYSPSTFILPGQGYWVRTSASGTLYFKQDVVIPASNHLKKRR